MAVTGADATSSGRAEASSSSSTTDASSTGDAGETATSSSSTDADRRCMPPSDGICSSQPFAPANDHVNGTTSPCQFSPASFIVDFNWAIGAEATYYGTFFELPCPDLVYDGSFTLISDTSGDPLVCGVTDQNGGDYAKVAQPATTLLQYTGIETSIPLELSPSVVPSGAYKLVCYSEVPRAATVTISVEAKR